MPKRTEGKTGDRVTYITRDVLAGCFVCKPDNTYIWDGKNAQGVAARHHDATGHQTWCDVTMSIKYGRDKSEPRQ